MVVNVAVVGVWGGTHWVEAAHAHYSTQALCLLVVVIVVVVIVVVVAVLV